MIRYSLKRIVMLIPLMLGVILAVFVILYFIPLSSLDRLEAFGYGDALDSFFKLVRMEDGFFAKYLRYCYNLFLKFDLGFPGSARLGDELGYRWKFTLILSGASLFFTMLFGLPMGIYSATHQNKWQDSAISLATLTLSSIPSYCLSILLILILSLKLGLLPTFGYNKPLAFIMPVLTITIGGVAQTARTVRSSVLETLEEQFITALRSKGLRERAVIYGHALKNSLIPIVSQLSELIGRLLCGTLVVEKLFSIPGIGYYLLNAVFMREYGGILGCTVIIAFMLAVINIVSDLIYVWVNPQIKARYTQKTPGRRSRRRRNEAQA